MTRFCLEEEEELEEKIDFFVKQEVSVTCTETLKFRSFLLTQRLDKQRDMRRCIGLHLTDSCYDQNKHRTYRWHLILEKIEIVT